MKIVISGSRHSEEREIIINLCKKIQGANIYDCNQFPTEEIYNGKQGEIDERIRNCDWYILVASTDIYGKYTFREWKVAMDLLKTKHSEQVVTVFRCENSAESVARQKIKEPEADGKDYFTFYDFKKYQLDNGLGENFDRTYSYDEGFENLKAVVDDELSLLMAKSWALRLLSKSVGEMTATDVYSNAYRTEKTAGFNPDIYIRREHDNKLEKTLFRFITVSGDPASGKTRTIYEYLRNKSRQNDRIIKLNSDNIAAVAAAIMEFDQWKWTPAAGEDKRQNLEHYYFVADQMNDMLWSDDNIGHLNTIVNLGVDKYKGHLLATILPSNLQRLENNAKWIENGISDKYETIFIPPVSPDEAEMFEKELGTNSDSPTYLRQVIGEYIPGFSDYHTSIETHAKDYNRDHNGIVENFVKAWNIVDTYRYCTPVPVGLVVSVLEGIAGRPIETNEVNALLNVVKMRIDAPGFSKKLPRADHGAYFDYDSEKVRMPYNPKYILRIENDYLWNVLCQRYSYDNEKPEDARQAAEYFAIAFFDENPISTLRRILARTETAKKDRFYGTNSDQVRKLVIESARDLAEDSATWSQNADELKLLIAMCISRSANIEEYMALYNDFAQISNNRFSLTEETVAELYGFGTSKSTETKIQIRKFLTSKGWNFDNFKPKSIFYPLRMILWESSFSIIEEYMEETVLPLLPGIDCTDSKNNSTVNYLFSSLIKKAESPENVKTILKWSDIFKFTANRGFFFALINASSKPWLKEKKNNRATIKLILDYFKDKELPAVSKPVMVFYMIRVASCFENAQEVYENHLSVIDSLPSIRGRIITSVLSSVDENDYGKVFAKYVMDDENRKMLNQANRNKLLSIFDFNDSIVLLHKLFDGKTPESTPDAYTIQAILKNRNNERTDNHAKKKAVGFLFYCEPVFAIMNDPLFENVFPDTILVSTLFARCTYRETEQYIVDNFIKPRLKRHFAAKYGLRPGSAEVSAKVELWVNGLEHSPEVVCSRLNTRGDLSLEESMRYVKNAFEKLLESGKPFKSDMFNHISDIIFKHLEKHRISLEQFDNARKEIQHIMRQKSPVIAADRIQRTLEDLIRKDGFFYFHWFRLFPEDAFADINANEFRPSDKLIEILPKTDANKIANGILNGAFHILDKNRFESSEKFFADNFEDFSLSWDFAQLVWGKYPDLILNCNIKDIYSLTETTAQGHEWDFLSDYLEQFNTKFLAKNEVIERYKTIEFSPKMMEKVHATMNENPGSTPSMEVSLKVIKSGMSAKMAVEYIETMFLSRGEPLTSKVYTELLKALHKRETSQKESASEVYKLLTDFEDRNFGYIFPDTNAMLCRIALIPNYFDKKRAFTQLRNTVQFLGILNYRQIIRTCANLFESGDDFVRFMLDEKEFFSLCSPHFPNVRDYAYFIGRLSNYYITEYYDSISEESYQHIYSFLSTRFDYDCKERTFHDVRLNYIMQALQKGQARNGFDLLLKDIEYATDKDTAPFRVYLEPTAQQ